MISWQKRAVQLAILVPFLLYFLWTGGHFVTAFQEEKHAHVFPVHMESDGWSNPDGARRQDLPMDSPAEGFSASNSAFVDMSGSTSTPLTEQEPTPEPVSTSSTSIVEGSTTSPAQGQVPPQSGQADQVDPPSSIVVEPPFIPVTDATTTSTELPEPNIQIPDQGVDNGVSSSTVSQITPTTDLQSSQNSSSGASGPPSQSSSVTPESGDSQAASSPGVSPGVDMETSSATDTTSFFDNLAPLASRYVILARSLALSALIPTVYATSSGASTDTRSLTLGDVSSALTRSGSTTPDVDTPTCAVLQQECHTLTFSDFNVGGSLIEKSLKDVRLNFSMAAIVPEGEQGGHLAIRFYHAGQWQSAGWIELSKTISNATNQGYFSEILTDISAWEDLSDLKVVLEYERPDGVDATRIYVDAVWLDAVYTDRAQDIISGNMGEPDDAPPNVSFGASTDLDPRVLVLDDGEKILFSYMNSSRDSLALRAHRAYYQVDDDGDVTAFLSVTNITKKPDDIRLFLSLPSGAADIEEIAAYGRDVPIATSTLVKANASYLCDGGWQYASSTDRYVCPDTQEGMRCSSLGDSGKKCVVADAVTQMGTTTIYANAWVPLKLSQVPRGNASVQHNVPAGYDIVASTNDTYKLLAGQSAYVRVKLHSGVGGKVPFVLSVKGDRTFGTLDASRLATESAVKAKAKARAHRTRGAVNDQVSDQSDFGANEAPKFTFKFNSQRGFLNRFKHFLFGGGDPYEVRSAKLFHESGQQERVPIDIKYRDDGQWTLSLEGTPRSFRPGKYNIDLEMIEDGVTYYDRVDFYWGVLAMNPDKATYAPGDDAHISIAALDDVGDVVCDAPLQLTIVTPAGVADDVQIFPGGGCGHNNTTDLPDYEAEYVPVEKGTYTMTLSYLDIYGNVINSTNDEFSVDENALLDIIRDGPTRIYPPSVYKMHMAITPRRGVNGSIIETLPEGFTVKKAPGASVTRSGGVIHLTWPIKADIGETKEFTYEFKAPDVSPYLYTLGPLTLKDTGGDVAYEEIRSWKIAADALPIATGVAWLGGNSTTNGTELNNANAYAIQWSSGEWDTTYFATSSNASQLYVNQPGDYLVAFTLPAEATFANNRNIQLQTDLRVNGSKVNLGIGGSANFERTSGSANTLHSSAHLHVLLHNLNAGDYIEAYTAALTTVNANDHVTIGSRASIYVEFIPSTETVFTAIATSTATTTAATNNFNPNSTTSIVWWDSGYRSDTGYSHSNSASPQNITLSSAGNYLVFINLPASSTVAWARPRGSLTLNGVAVPGGYLKQGITNTSRGATEASFHWSGVVVATTSSSTLQVGVKASAAAGSSIPNNDVGSVFIQKLPSTDIFLARATTTSGGTNWNSAASTNILWGAEDIKDTADYSHSTATNSHQITVLRAGDYLLSYNDSLYGAGTRGVNPRVSVLVNGGAVSGAQTKAHIISNQSRDAQSSGSLVFLLRNLNQNDVISLQTIQDTNAGTVTADNSALIMLWRKQAQSTFIQDIGRWYANADSATTTDPWPAGVVDLDEGDAITTGNSVKSGDALRLRLAVQTNATVSAYADQFKLQYAPGDTCSPALAWTDVGSTTGSAIWRGHTNSNVSNHYLLSSTNLQLSVSSTTETYEDNAVSTTTPNGIAAGKDGEWDWSIEDNGADTGTSYCFRMVKSDGSVLKDYNNYPQLITNASPDAPTQSTPFDNEKFASTTPWFTFSTTDDNGEDVDYRIEVSTDPSFMTTVIDDNSISNLNDFDNITTPSDKSPFNQAQTIRYKWTGAALSNNTTYYWRVQSIDTNGSNTYGSWSSTQSFTVDTSVNVSTWFQTTTTQFNNDTLSGVEATSTGNDVGLSGSNTTGSIWSQSIDYDWHTSGNSWGNISWHNATSTGTILYHVEYYTSTSSWAIIPDSDLAGNSAGTSTQPINIASLDPDTYGTIRVRADFTKVTGTPRLQDWTVSWALSVAAPTLVSPFDNEKISTTTPDFLAYSTDPQGDKLEYEIQVSSSTSFTPYAIDRVSTVNAGFSDYSSSTAVHPFPSGDTANFHLQNADRLASSTTYWWRARAKDPTGGNAWSLWSDSHSFTTDTTVQQSTWFQTTTGQFNTDSLSRLLASNNDLTANSDTGKIAIYRPSTAGETITTAEYKNAWNITTRQDDIYSLSVSNTDVILPIGYYAVMYGVRFDASGGTNRTVTQSALVLASTTLPTGWSQAFIRQSAAGVSALGYSAGGGIIKVTSDNSPLYLKSFRTDTNPGVTVTRKSDAGLQIIRLDSSWSYARLSRQSKQTGPTSATWVTVAYDREDELDTGAYTHSSGSGSITLKQAGHYLVFANTYGSLANNSTTDTMVDQKITLNGYDLPGSFTTVYMRGNTNTNGIYEGAAAVGMIIQATTTNEVLKVQVKRSLGTSSWTIDSNPNGTYVNRTGLTIVKIPEADFIQLQLQYGSSTNIATTGLTPLAWDNEVEKDASFTHSNTTNQSRITVNTNGDYLFLSGLYSDTGTRTANLSFYQVWSKNGGVYDRWGQSMGWNDTAATDVGNWSAHMFSNLVNGDYVQSFKQATSTAAASPSLPATSTRIAVQGVRIGSLNEADVNAKAATTTPIVFSYGYGQKWYQATSSDVQPPSTSIKYQLFYATGTSYKMIPDSDLANNSTGLTMPVDLTGLDVTTYGTLKLQATFTCGGGNCPSIHEWAVLWTPGVTISGTAKQFDQSTNVTSGTVAVAVNGVLQRYKNSTIVNGVWSIPNVAVGTGDVVTAFVSSASGAQRAVAITKYDGVGNITGMKLNEMHLTLGSDDNPTISNTDIGRYDNSVSGNSAIFNDVGAGGDLTVCYSEPCENSRLLIASSTIFRPSSTSNGNATTPNIQIDGTLMADGNTINVSRSWLNNASFLKGTSAVVFTATSTTESITSSSGTSTAFYAVTFGSGSGTARWNLVSPIYASSTMSINFGSLAAGATSTINLDGNLSIGASGLYLKNQATTTFMGSGSSTWTDNTASKQDLGKVVIDGSAKTVQLGSNVAATDITVGGDDTLDANNSGSYSITLYGNWTNNNVFTSRNGTVTFAATTTGKVIAPGSSSFYNLTFNGSGGNWSFSSQNVTSTNDFTITNGIVTLPTGTTTVGGSFSNSSSFVHNNGAVLLNASSAKTINASSSPFYDLAFSGSGSWSFTGLNATSTRNTTITQGTVTLPQGVLAVGGSFLNNGGSFSGGGTLRMYSSSDQSIRFNGSSPWKLTVAGNAIFTFLDTNATTTFTTRFEQGTTTLPSGYFTIGGSLISAGGAFSSNGGTVKFNATTTGNSITVASSTFANLLISSASGGWTVTGNATSTLNMTVGSSSNFTVASGTVMAVGGTFTNLQGGAATTWTNSTLYLYGAGNFTINSKTQGGDGYGTLKLAPNVFVRMWNSSSSVPTVDSAASLYSQNNNAVSGDLYIWGAYVGTTGEYWDYATDFDGTALGGNSRRVNVRVANNSSVSVTSGTLDMVGSATASTTIANQGSGTFGFSISGGTLNAQYYTVASTSAAGFSISGATVVSSLSNGAFTVSTNGYSAITVSSTTIGANPNVQFLQNMFATTTGITATNVTETGIPDNAAYWWFRNAYGSLAGEAFDSDPGPGGGNPGYVQWDDSGFTITLSGHVYADHGATAITPGTSLKVVTSNGSTYTGSTGAGGAYSIPNVFFRAGATIAAFIDNTSNTYGTTITRSAVTDISDFDIYQNAIILRHADANPLLTTDLTGVDASADSDIRFTISGNDMTVKPGSELFVWYNRTFAPSGNVTLQSGGNGSAFDGRLWIASTSRMTLTGSPTISIGGGLYVGTSSVFSTASSTIAFTATTTGKSIYSAASSTMWNLTFNGSGGQWSLDGIAGVATTTVTNAFTFSAGTLIGTGDLVLRNGGLSGAGTFTMTGGTVRLEGTGSFGSANPWQFYNLTFGSGAAASSTKQNSATTTIKNILKISSGFTLNAGTTTWALTGGGTGSSNRPFSQNGTFNVMSAPFVYSSTAAIDVTGETYANLTLAPSGGGSPTYTLTANNLFTQNLTIGDGANAVTVDLNANDPSTQVSGNMLIGASATLIASNIGTLTVAGNWTNSGTFTPSGQLVTFNATASGKTINPGSSSFYDVDFNSATGGWTITNNATSTHNFSLTSAANFTVASGTALEVRGTFTNSVANATTTWTNSRLFLNSGTSFTINAKTNGDGYGTLLVGTSTNVRMWNSSSTIQSVSTTGSLYSMNDNAQSGALKIWGAYARSSGSDYWSYATDFDGTDISATPRQVTVSIASSSVLTFSGGVLDIIGGASATTTVQNQGAGAYTFVVNGTATFFANYYAFRNMDQYGLQFYGTPTVSSPSLSYGDFLLSSDGGTMMSVAGSVITQNPLLLITNAKFATSSGVTAGYNVTATSSTASYWKFTKPYGNYAGESYDNDVGGDPGYIHWDDSHDQITVSGTVYSSEGSGVSSVCDNTSQVVRLKMNGVGSYAVSCNSSTGAYSIPNVSFNPGDETVIYVATSSGIKAANVTVGMSTSTSGMDLYENRTIVRHEASAPMTIATMDTYDGDQDSNVPFWARLGATNTLALATSTKLIVWTGKTFAPGGNVTIPSGGNGQSYDGSLELYATSTFSGSGTQQYSVGGNFIVDNTASFNPGNSTVTLTATTTGKTITMSTSTFYKVVFNGGGGNWSFTGPATSTSNFTITRGTVTLPSGTLYVGGSFINTGATGGVFMHNNGVLVLNSTATGNSVQVSTSTLYDLTTNGNGGAWSFADTNATSSRNVTITKGTLTLPSGIFAIGGSLTNSDTLTHNSGTVKFNSSVSGNTITLGTSNLSSVLFVSSAGGTWTFLDTNDTLAADLTIATGTVTFPTGTLTIGGSFVNSGGTFANSNGTVLFNATAVGKTIMASSSPFYNLTFNSGSGGWTITDNATTTYDLNLTAASLFTQATGTTLAVGNHFTNSVGGSATNWTNSTLYLYSGDTYSINTKTSGGDAYASMLVGASTQLSSWNSSAATTTIGSSAYLYSQNNAGVSGALNIYGTYSRSSGTDYWSYATDFDGTDISGSPRQVSVFVGTSSSIAYSGTAILNMVGASGATTTVRSSITTSYPFAFSGATFNANYYDMRNLDSSGLNFSGTPVVSSLSNGYFEISAASGTAITLPIGVIDTNAGLANTAVGFATTSANLRGYNVEVTGGSTGNTWTFTSAYGNFAGEAHDMDGASACGSIRWDDSNCFIMSEAHYRWRNDDGGEGAPNSNWYNASWLYRERIAITNPNSSAYTNLPVKIDIPYNSHMLANFDDLRFTDSSGTSTLYFWREDSTAATSTVWVKIPSISARGSVVIYMYYGNGGAGIADDGANTMTFLEDFEANSIASYSGNTSQSGTPYFDMSQSGSFNHNGTYGLPGSESSGQTPDGIYKTGSQTAQGKTMRWFQYVNADSPSPPGGAGSDEPCVLFGLQSDYSSTHHDYAVCLDEFSNATLHPRVSIARDVHSRDQSGTVLASTTVSWSTGWYEVIVDWLTTNAINVRVYNSSGSLFASVSTTTSTYASGGYGFAHFNQAGGWDTFMVKPYTATTPTYVFGVEQQSGGATFRAAEDTALTGLLPSTNARVRFSIQNSGNAVNNTNYRFQVASKGSALSCQSVPTANFVDVPVFGSCGSSVACMASSTMVADLASTTPLLSYPASMAFTNGQVVQKTHQQTDALNIASTTATELEYVFQMTNYANQTNYCYRAVKNVGGTNTDLDNYDQVAEAVLSFPPFFDYSDGGPQLNGGNPISLTEGTSTYVYATSTVTDHNGYSDMVTATGTIYRSTVAGGPDCASDYNNCYQMNSSQCTFTNCAGDSCTLSCRATIAYHADPTDASSTADWVARLSVQDSTGLRDTQSTLGRELNTLYGLEVNVAGIDFGSLYNGGDTGAVNATTTTRNTGNTPIDVQVFSSATSTNGTDTIAPGQQRYATTTFTYGSCAICAALSGTATPVDVNIPKPTSTSSAQQKDIYWGIAVPIGVSSGTYTGQTSFVAVAPGG